MSLAKLIVLCGLGLALSSLPTQAQVLIEPDSPGSYSGRANEVGILLGAVDNGDDTTTADLTVDVEGDVVYQKRFEDLFNTFMIPMVQIIEMDASNDAPEILVQQYSGGAHCCNEMTVISKTDDGTWAEIQVGAFNGGPDAGIASDLNGDGTAEIKTIDNRFLYQFASYAGSFAPVQILAIRNGAVEDVTADEAFEWQVRADLDDVGMIPDSGPPRNSWLATYTALQLLLGEPEPFARADTEFDPDSDWGLQYCLDDGVAEYDCPDDRVATRTFPEALRLFLTQTGYME